MTVHVSPDARPDSVMQLDGGAKAASSTATPNLPTYTTDSSIPGEVCRRHLTVSLSRLKGPDSFHWRHWKIAICFLASTLPSDTTSLGR